MASAEELKPLPPTPALLSNLSLISSCDNFPYHETTPLTYARHINHYYTFRITHCPSPIGFMLPSVANILDGTPGWELDHEVRTCTLVEGENEEERSRAMARTCEAMRKTGYFKVLDGWRGELYPVYGEVMEDAEEKGKGNGNSGEGNDELALERELQGKRRHTELLCSVERAASPLFGIVTYGVHMTAFVRGDSQRKRKRGDLGLSHSSDPTAEQTEQITTADTTSTIKLPTSTSTSSSTSNLKIWVPRRSATKQTYPSMLDNTVAGGISVGETPISALLREAEEEASLPEVLVKERMVSVGTVTYFHIRDERAGGETGLLQPECQFVFDLDLSSSPQTQRIRRSDHDGGEDQRAEDDDAENEDEDNDNEDDRGVAIPHPSDNEVASFELMTIPDIQAAMGRGEFKPNCALVLLDFFVRHGVLTRENERDFTEIVARLHRRFGFPMG